MDLRLKQNWDNLIDRFEKSGLTKADFCRSQKITESQFYYYAKFHRNKLQTQELSTSLQVVQKSNFIPMVTQKEFKITINNSIGLTFDSLPEPIWIANLIKSIGNSNVTV